MPLFAGLPRTAYRDVPRAVGRPMSAEGFRTFRTFRIIEQEEGLALPVTRGGF